MTSGRYFSDRLIYYAIGAPRADLTGKVRDTEIVSWHFICSLWILYIALLLHIFT